MFLVQRRDGEGGGGIVLLAGGGERRNRRPMVGGGVQGVAPILYKLMMISQFRKRYGVVTRARYYNSRVPRSISISHQH